MAAVSFVVNLLGRIWSVLASVRSPFGFSYMYLFAGLVIMSLLIGFVVRFFGVFRVQK